MDRGTKIEGSNNAFQNSASVNSERPAADSTPRVIPKISSVSVPLETNLILWQHDF
jgi:hypothetical protein